MVMFRVTWIEVIAVRERTEISSGIWGVDKSKRKGGSARIYTMNADPATARTGVPAAETAPSPDTPAETDRAERLVFTVEEAAYLLNISRALAYGLVARGVLPSIRLGRRLVVPRHQLALLLEGSGG